MMNIFVRNMGLGALLLAAILGSMAALAAAPLQHLTPLSVDFNDKTPGQPLGTGGAAVGEPVNLSFLDTLIVETSPGENFLQVSMDPTFTSARSMRWHFEDDLEVSEGLISISMDFKPSVRDRYSFTVQENGGSSKIFLWLIFNASGQLFVNDAAGLAGQYFNVYDAGDSIHIEMLFDMDARTSSLKINGNPLFAGREHGISDRGVGSLRTGFESSSNGSPFALDNLLVLASVPLPLVLDADFNDKTQDQPIGTGGAAVGEPVSTTSIVQQVISVGAGDNALQLSNAVLEDTNAVLWEFLENIPIHTGIVAFEMDLLFEEYVSQFILVRNFAGGGSQFGAVYFLPDPASNTSGRILVREGATTAGFVGAFQTQVPYRLRMIFDMDQGTYTVVLNDTVLVQDRAHGGALGAAIENLHTGFDANSLVAAPMLINNLQVGASDAPIIPARITFLQEPTDGEVSGALSPAFEVAVDNVFGELVPDGTLVSLVIDTGPAGAVLSGAIEPMVGGVARFENLTVDLPGTYRLRAIAGDAEKLGNTDIVISDPLDRIFEDGFEGGPD